ncbi:substrate-binding domain-containing protein [Miniimonas sp. S16]|uniref:substrate-binding domain-containing protein n=1 Tax=Miniimonas sp. S16 TaxID=2171623 RepID=UPI001901655F|nr:substrate-binding domain-containing protein [Miniimonas sp. S16]
MSTTDESGMLPATRRSELLEILHRQGTLRVRDLVDVLGVSAITIRRDIAQLADEGLVKRVHGGATLPDGDASSASGAPASGSSGTPGGASSATAGARGAGAAELAGPPRRIGMLVPSLDYYWPGVVRGAEEAALDHHMRIVLRGSSYEQDTDRRQLERLLAKGVDALVVAPQMDLPTTPDTLAWLAGLGIPVVLVERSGTAGAHREALESVVTDHGLGAEMAVRHLASLGHRRVGLVTSLHSPHSAVIRRAWQDASAECGLVSEGAVDVAVPDKVDPGWEAGLEAALEMCRASGTTALLVHADPEAIAIAQHAEDHGLVVPRDLSIVAYDDEVASLFSPPISAVRPPRRSVGETAVTLVASRLADPGRPTRRVIISPTLRVRSTSVPPGGE